MAKRGHKTLSIFNTPIRPVETIVALVVLAAVLLAVFAEHSAYQHTQFDAAYVRASFNSGLWSYFTMFCIVTVVSLVGLWRLKMLQAVPITNCVLGMALAYGTLATAAYMSVLPNGPAEHYSSMRCGNSASITHTPDPGAGNGFPCTATKQAYGWPIVTRTIYTNVRSLDGSLARLDSYEETYSGSLNWTPWRTPTYVLLEGFIALCFFLPIIVRLPLAKRLRGRADGSATLLKICSGGLGLLAVYIVILFLHD